MKHEIKHVSYVISLDIDIPKSTSHPREKTYIFCSNVVSTVVSAYEAIALKAIYQLQLIYNVQAIDCNYNQLMLYKKN
uniref:Uncharacterized protein n=1 Tax=Arundo donax TaxID=35708 RepID=A0A0A9DXH1_ARUDO